MFLSRIHRWTEAWRRLAMRVSWRQLPPLTTHGIAFLAGTLVLKPQTSSRFKPPRQILLPLEIGAARLPPRDAYWLIQIKGKESCQILQREVKVWRSEGDKNLGYLVIPRDEWALNTLKEVLSRSSKSLSLSPSPQPLCTSPERIHYD